MSHKKYTLLLSVFILAGWLTNSHAALGPQTSANSVDFCQTCTTLSDAENFVLADVEARNAGGHHTVEVINLNSPSQTWFIEYEYFPRDYPLPLIDSATVGTSADNFVAVTAVEAQSNPIVLNITPKSPLYGTDNFSTLRNWTPETLWPQVNLLWMTTNTNLKTAETGLNWQIIWSGILYFFGHGPVVTVVFSDGSTGKFYFSPSSEGVIQFIKGSGRNPDGSYYAMGGDGGGGGNGDNYLRPNGSGGFNLYFIDDYFSCGVAYQDSKPYYVCVEEF